MPTRAANLADSAQSLAEQAFESPLGWIARAAPIGVPAHTPLAQALATMQERHIGSLLVLDDAGAALGILTREDIVARVTLPQLPLSTPISQVMSSPVSTLTVHHTLHDAALLMARQGIRHVPVTDEGRVVGLLSEHDVAAMQRTTLQHVSTTIRAASDVGALGAAAHDIRRFACSLLEQGVGARQLTQLISHLNDVLTEHLVQMLAAEQGLDLERACWLAFGSEGRSEQTIATDQDNGLVFDSDDPPRDRARWLALGQRVNEVLHVCGYPLCKGHVMAGNPTCCLTAAEWCERFTGWIDHGAPDDLLQASIYFDFRAVAGRRELARGMRELVTQQAASQPRFTKQMADNALRNRAPLNWRGAIETQALGGRAMLDLKFHGATIFVDAARLYALARGIAHTGTRERFEALAQLLEVPPHESQAWVGGFEYLQTLRLQAQMARDPAAPGNPNLIELDALNDIERRMLKESLRIARRLQQRMELDYQR